MGAARPPRDVLARPKEEVWDEDLVHDHLDACVEDDGQDGFNHQHAGSKPRDELRSRQFYSSEHAGRGDSVAFVHGFADEADEWASPLEVGLAPSLDTICCVGARHDVKNGACGTAIIFPTSKDSLPLQSSARMRCSHHLYRFLLVAYCGGASPLQRDHELCCILEETFRTSSICVNTSGAVSGQGRSATPHETRAFAFR